MSYRCNLCRAKVQHGLPRRLHVIYRRDGSISREISACSMCLDLILQGTSLDELREKGEQNVLEEAQQKAQRPLVIPMMQEQQKQQPKQQQQKQSDQKQSKKKKLPKLKYVVNAVPLKDLQKTE